MREKWARNTAFLTGLSVLIVTAFFAYIQNPPQPTVSSMAKPDDKPSSTASLSQADSTKQEQILAGRRVYLSLGCGMCHSIAGQGNPRNPLDGIGGKRSEEGIRQWILAPAELADRLPSYAFRAKQAYRQQSQEELDALVDYLSSLN